MYYLTEFTREKNNMEINFENLKLLVSSEFLIMKLKIFLELILIIFEFLSAFYGKIYLEI